MKQAKNAESLKAPERTRPSLSQESDENQLISLSIDAAKKVLTDYLEGREKKIPTSIIMMYGKYGTSLNKLERANMETQRELMLAKKQSLESQAKADQLFADAMKAMQRYSGYDDSEVSDEY